MTDVKICIRTLFLRAGSPLLLSVDCTLSRSSTGGIESYEGAYYVLMKISSRLIHHIFTRTCCFQWSCTKSLLVGHKS